MKSFKNKLVSIIFVVVLLASSFSFLPTASADGAQVINGQYTQWVSMPVYDCSGVEAGYMEGTLHWGFNSVINPAGGYSWVYNYNPQGIGGSLYDGTPIVAAGRTGGFYIVSPSGEIRAGSQNNYLVIARGQSSDLRIHGESVVFYDGTQWVVRVDRLSYVCN